MFSLCKDFEDLSFEDKTDGSSSSSTILAQPSSYGYRGPFDPILSYAVGHILLGAILLMRKYELFYRAASPLFWFITIPVV